MHRSYKRVYKICVCLTHQCLVTTCQLPRALPAATINTVIIHVISPKYCTMLCEAKFVIPWPILLLLLFYYYIFAILSLTCLILLIIINLHWTAYRKNNDISCKVHDQFANIWNRYYDRCICVSCALCQLITITCQRPLSRHKLHSVKFTVFQTTLSTAQKKCNIQYKKLKLLLSFIKSWRARKPFWVAVVKPRPSIFDCKIIIIGIVAN